MNLEQLEARLKTLENKLGNLEDIEKIKKVQRAYGYYLERIMYNEVTDLWCDGPDAEMQWLGVGVFKGKETIRKVWATVREWPAEATHMAIQLSPFITVDPDGKTAHGRWYCLGESAARRSQTTDDIRAEDATKRGPAPKGEIVTPVIMLGLYENDYVKQDGIWRIKILRYGVFFYSNLAEQILTPEIEAEKERLKQEHLSVYPFSERWSRSPRQDWPATYIRPFHFKHPVTGKATNEEEWNAAHPVPLPPGGEKWIKS
jgi:hypothetical protein